MVTVLLFASLRDAAGRSELRFDLAETLSVRELFQEMQRQFPAVGNHAGALLIAVNEEYSSWDSRVKPGDEVAFFPPVSGGGR